MDFERPLMLSFLFLPAAWWWLRARWREEEMKRLRLFVRPVLWDRVDIQPPPRRLASRILWTVSLVFGVISASGPMWGVSDAMLPTGGENISVALDVSSSMATTDEVPSRLGRASSEILRLVDGLPGVRFSLVLFSGHARLAVPGTLDREFVAARLPRSPWDGVALAPGTRLGDLVGVMIASLPEEDLESRIGIIFSDGGFHDFSVEGSIQEANDAGLTIVAVGMGSIDGAPLPDSTGGIRTDASGDTVFTSLQEETLTRLAEGTGGFYVRLSGTGDLTSLVEDMLSTQRQMKAERIEGGSSGRRYQYFLGACLLAAALAMVIERRDR
jgi:Ca-activated chloride channel family protein